MAEIKYEGTIRFTALQVAAAGSGPFSARDWAELMRDPGVGWERLREIVNGRLDRAQAQAMRAEQRRIEYRAMVHQARQIVPVTVDLETFKTRPEQHLTGREVRRLFEVSDELRSESWEKISDKAKAKWEKFAALARVPVDRRHVEPETVIACGIVTRPSDGRVLLARRQFSDRAHPGLWEFPGGKVEPGESTYGACERELREELGIYVSALQPVLVTTIERLRFVFHLCRMHQTCAPSMIECDGLGWFDRRDVIKYPDLTEPTRRALECLIFGGRPDV